MAGDPFDADGARPVLARRYRIGALVGSGGMADVYRAYDLKLERPVAVKRFVGNSNAIDRKRFDDEARLLARLSHPGLVPVYDAGMHEGSRYLVMRLVDGPSLHVALSKVKPTVDEVLSLAGRLLPTLAYVHDHGIVHRDIKPANILVDLDGDAYLADFGLARLIGTDGITRSGEVVGTAAYLAPEQVRGEQATPASDVYAIGLVLLQCLTGRQEYRGSQAEAALARLTRDPVIPKWLPTEVATLLREMTSADPADRPSSAQCADRFAQLLGDEPPTKPMRPPARPRRRVVVAAAAGVVVATGVALAFTLRPDEPAATTIVETPPSSTTSTATTTIPHTATSTSSGDKVPTLVTTGASDPAGRVPPGQVKKTGADNPPPGKGKHG